MTDEDEDEFTPREEGERKATVWARLSDDDGWFVVNIDLPDERRLTVRIDPEADAVTVSLLDGCGDELEYLAVLIDEVEATGRLTFHESEPR